MSAEEFVCAIENITQVGYGDEQRRAQLRDFFEQWKLAIREEAAYELAQWIDKRPKQ